MKLACPACQHAILIDDAKVPAHPFALRCPQCQHKFPVNPAAPPNAAEGPTTSAPAPPPEEEAPAPPAMGGPQSLHAGGPQWEQLKREVALEVLKHLGIQAPADGQEDDEFGDTPTALVCEDEALFQGILREVLQKAGYRVDIAPSAKSAIEMVYRGSYEVVTVDNRFPDDAEGGITILQAINGLPGDRRRKMFVAFVSADLTTMDTNSAFILGANLTVSKKDIRRFEKILAQGRHEHEKLYRTFYQVQEELHRAEI